MRIRKVDDTIDNCKDFLKEKDAFGTTIEAYLTRYLLVLISASFEEEIEKIFIERGSKKNDVFVKAFFENEMPNQLKSVGVSKISNFLGKFGNEYRDKFIEDVSTTPEATKYANLIKNRHLVAHETQEPQMTFNEVVKAYEDSSIVIDKLKQIIDGEAEEEI